MNNILYKDLKISIHKFFLFMPLLAGSLFLIPQWPFFIALMYFFFISVPNIYSSYNAQNDFGFTVMMPVDKKTIVKGKMQAALFLEFLHLLMAVVFALIHNRLYGEANFLLDLNASFFGISLMMFGLFNIVFYPLYFRTAYRFGKPLIIGTVAVLLFITAVEIIPLYHDPLRALLEGSGRPSLLFQYSLLPAGAILFALASFAAYRISAKRFEKIDL